MQFAVYISDTPVTLKKSRSSNQNGHVNPKEGYNHAKYKESCHNSIREKANVKVYFQMRKYVIISLDHV